MTDAAHTESQPWSVQRLLAWTADFFNRHNVDEPRLAAEILLSHAMGCPRIQLYARFDHIPGEDVLSQYRNLVRRAANREPIAYLVGCKEFFSLDFQVTPDVLIPRPETEILVEKVIDYVREGTNQVVHVLEIGTGSGCIIVALLKYLPQARGVATDICSEAIEIARQNASRHGVDSRVEFICADRLAIPPELRPESGFTCIVSNPPYVSAAEYSDLDPTIRDYEPRAALTDEADGFSFYRTIVTEAPAWLATSGAVFLETADDQAANVRELFMATGRFRHDATWRDLAGPFERVVRFSLK